MPSRNQVKSYEKEAFYHLYNRGVGKMSIFRAERDYKVFLYYLKVIFSPLEYLEKELSLLKQKIDFSVRGKDYLKILKLNRLQRAIHQGWRLEVYKNVELLVFNLMPNHFHLLIYQKEKRGIEALMRRLATAHSVYFTKANEHVGPLFQGRYHASHLYYEPDLQALVTARYIERNSLELLSIENRSQYKPSFQGIEDYPFSSLRYYLAEEKGVGKGPVWLNTKRLLETFAKIKARPNGILEERVARHKSYTDFVLSGDDFTPEDVRLGHLASLF